MRMRITGVHNATTFVIDGVVSGFRIGDVVWGVRTVYPSAITLSISI